MDPIVWIDLEMTGLDPDKERIIEAAVIVTDSDLNIIEEGPNIVIHQEDDLLNAMDAWNRKHHKASGLTERVKASTISEARAEAELLSFVQKHCKERQSPLAGNSIHQDRRFMRRYMPRLDDYLHYRIIDVSTIKELAKRWYPGSHDRQPAKTGNHRALEDIRESIEELRYYRDRVFRPIVRPEDANVSPEADAKSA